MLGSPECEGVLRTQMGHPDREPAQANLPGRSSQSAEASGSVAKARAKAWDHPGTALSSASHHQKQR